MARSVVLEAVNVDPGSSELPAFVAQVRIIFYMHCVLSHRSFAEKSISLTYNLIVFKLVFSFDRFSKVCLEQSVHNLR